MKRIDGDLDLEYLGSMTNALTGAISPDLNYINVIPFNYQIATTHVPGYQAVNKFGHLDLVNTADPPIVVTGVKTTSFTGFPSVFESCEIASSSADDSGAGIGARTVEIGGLDVNFLRITETVTLNGTTQVPLVNVFSRVNRMRVMTAGSSGENLGVITIRYNPTTTTQFVRIPVGVNQTLSSVYTVPLDTTAFLLRYSFNMSRSGGNPGSSEISFRKRPPGGVFNAFRYETLTTGAPDNITFTTPERIEPGSDMMVLIEDVSDNGTSVSTSYGLILVDNSLLP